MPNYTFSPQLQASIFDSFIIIVIYKRGILEKLTPALCSLCAGLVPALKPDARLTMRKTAGENFILSVTTIHKYVSLQVVLN